ncbi:glycosyltransferase [Chryseobacterium pennipullorum]|uniref:Glycosyltransferase 2-like domain-containing protein n=1 Tax=Chryseobacterium pennipullorum TaxID=2258963 RepID=A0A3D9B8B1_9FLAO|nr:glycosyltransferase [Chryseobacterium pennipullorum]REC49598.1 hypothetical protein DRF67_03780 [Chryseobacterium pennipullorum]
MENISKILFIIVLYNEKLIESSSFQTITSSAKAFGFKDKELHLYVYDNSPTGQDKPDSSFWNIEYVSDTQNSGLSIAYNKAAEFAERKELQYIFLMDQDTTFPSDTIKKYHESLQRNPSIKMYAPILKIENGKIMSPFRCYMKWGKFLDVVKPGIYDLKKIAPINSGLCVNVKSFFEVGGYNEKVRVDGADYQFIERFKRRYKDFEVVDVIGHQAFSMFEKNPQKLISRYSIFLQDVKNFEEHEFGDRFFYSILIIKRTLRLTFDTKSIMFIKLLFRKILIR